MSHDLDPTSARISRRSLLGAAAATAVATGFMSCQKRAERIDPGTDSEPHSMVRAGDVVLFQGDSITDAGRSREQAGEPNSQPAMGKGYAWLATSGLLVDRTEDGIRVFNRGISGNKVHQLAARWDEDCLGLEPDVLSILIGVNDIWHTKSGNYDGTVEVYERDYGALLERTRSALPEVKLIVCEPFVLRCGAIDDTWFPEFDEYRAAAKRVAEQHEARWVGFQAMFDEASRLAPPEHWAADGVHPSSAGAALMAQYWLKTVRGA